MILFYFLVGIMPLTEHPIWGRFIAEFTVFKYIGAACVLYAVLRLVTCRTIPAYFRTWQARFWVVLYMIAMASYFTKSLRGALEFSPFLSYTSFLLLFFVTLTVVDSLRRLRWTILVSIGSTAFASLYVIREWQKYHSLYAGFRPGSIVGDANYFTAPALFSVSLAFYMTQKRGPHWEKLFCLGSLVLTLVAITLCASRGGFLGLTASFLFVVWRSRQRVRNLIFAGALVLPLSLSLPISPLHRLLYPSDSDKWSTKSHIVAWKAGLQMVRAHPFIGIGLGNFKPMMPLYTERGEGVDTMAHNVYIGAAAELGLPGLVIFLGILYCTYRSLEKVRRWTFRSGPSLLCQSAMGIQAGLVGYAVSSFFLSAEYQKLFWLMLFLSMCLPLLTRLVARNLRATTAAFRSEAATSCVTASDHC